MDKKPKSCSHGHSKTLLLNCWSRLWIIVGHKTIKFFKLEFACEMAVLVASKSFPSDNYYHTRDQPSFLRSTQRSFDLLQQGFLITKLHNIITFLYQSFLLDSGANQFRQNFIGGTPAFFTYFPSQNWFFEISFSTFWMFALFKNYLKCSIWFFVLLELTYLVTLFDRKLQVFKSSYFKKYVSQPH